MPFMDSDALKKCAEKEKRPFEMQIGLMHATTVVQVQHYSKKRNKNSKLLFRPRPLSPTLGGTCI